LISLKNHPVIRTAAVTIAARQHQRIVRLLHILLAAVAVSACTATSFAIARPAGPDVPVVSTNCSARDAASSIEWHVGDPADTRELARWCRAVGSPVFVARPVLPDSDLPALDELVTLSWNAHLAEGELATLIEQLRGGALTGGRPVAHFVLLVQELYRHGDEVPAFDIRDRSAFAIRRRDPKVFDIDDHAATLGLSMLYVPSMRNGPELREDRGNAIISTEPLLDPFALELPLARQRRVALGAAVQVMTPRGVRRLELVDAHLEPLSSPKTLWLFKNPRGHQVRSILDLLGTPRFTDPSLAGVVLGGDFNTVRAGAGEEAYRLARAWSSSLDREDARNTHMMGRLDYLFFRLADGWTASTQRLDARFGSDHFPVIGVFRPLNASR
jgi:endonuclease/exonuclease/phosphatase family metal-dependent hydrolase